MPNTQGSETNCKESDEVVVVRKYVKAYGAKDRNIRTFLEGKHARHWRSKGKHGNTTTRSKNIVEETLQT